MGSTNPANPDPSAPGWTSQKGYLPDPPPTGVDISQMDVRLAALERYGDTKLVTGQETFDRGLLSSNNGTTGTGNLRLTYFTARKSETSTQSRVYTGSTAAAATPTLARFGLFQIAANGDGTLVASTANDAAGLFLVAFSPYTRTWTTPFAIVAGQVYAHGILVVTAAAPPTLCGGSIAATTDLLAERRLNGVIGGQADLPASFLNAAVGQSGTRHYAVLLP